MNGFAVAFLVLNAIALLLLPRRWAFLPLLVGVCYMTLGQSIELGPFTFTVTRMLIAVGALRVVARGERLPNRFNELDRVIVLWCVCAAFSGLFHRNIGPAIVSRLGSIYNVAGIYFLLRIFCSSVDDVVRMCRATAFLLAVVAIEMTYEHVANHNLFSLFGGVSEIPEFRAGRIRASGPFAHSILAGTVGAVMLPLMIAMWRSYRLSAIIGILVCLTIVVASSSSGPILTALLGLGGLCLWSLRGYRRFFGPAVVSVYLFLDVVMKAPPYYLLARFDVVEGSTGWYRARLIESSIEHLNEWWLVGTDYTRHWMVTPGAWSSDQADITNHYLNMGITGGLPLMLLFMATIVKGFALVGRELGENYGVAPAPGRQLMVWAFGSALFAHAVTCISVSYFDQSFVFLYLTLAAIASTPSTLALESAAEQTRPTSQRFQPSLPHRRRQPVPAVGSLRSATSRFNPMAVGSVVRRGKS